RRRRVRQILRAEIDGSRSRPIHRDRAHAQLVPRDAERGASKTHLVGPEGVPRTSPSCRGANDPFTPRISWRMFPPKSCGAPRANVRGPPNLALRVIRRTELTPPNRSTPHTAQRARRPTRRATTYLASWESPFFHAAMDHGS